MASTDTTTVASGGPNDVVALHARTPEPLVGAGPAADPRAVLGDLLGEPPAVELTSSCTHALEAAATVLGIGAGDEVVVPAFTFPSTANAFVLRGATIRFADIDPRTGNVSPASVAEKLGGRTRAVVCTHYAGVACDMPALAALCEPAGVDLVEDAAHGLFGSLGGTPLGRFGRLGALSFQRTKNISCIEGGAIVVNDPGLVESVQVALEKGTNRVAFESGRVRSYEWVGPGSAWRLPEPAVGMLADQLEHRDHIQRVRHHVWARYHAELADWAATVGARLPTIPAGVQHPAHLFWLVLPPNVAREQFVERCADRGVEVARHYGSLPSTRFGEQIRNPADSCDVAREWGDRLVRLPVHQDLDDGDVDRVIDAVTAASAGLVRRGRDRSGMGDPQAKG